MNLSISDSDPSRSEGADAGAWRRWLKTYVVALLLGGFALYAFVLVSDPYSTGRFSPFEGHEIAISNRPLADVGRARDPAFDAAIVGNSHAARVEPDRLDAMTGLRFVHLGINALGPDEQLILASAFARNHGAAAKAMVFVLDQYWCGDTDDHLLHYPNFPSWLYAPEPWPYLGHVMSIDGVQASVHRWAIRLFGARPPARRDGFIPQEQRGVWTPERVAYLSAFRRMTAAPYAGHDYPAMDKLAAFAVAMPPQTSLVLLMIPVHVAMIPVPGTDAARWLDACKAKIDAIAKARPNTVYIDHMVDNEAARDSANFWDGTHARDNLVRLMERDIGAALAPKD
jgi:hypothetical protein